MKQEAPPRFKDVEIDGVIYRTPAHDAFVQTTEDAAPIDAETPATIISAETIGWDDKVLTVGSVTIDLVALVRLVGVDPCPRFAIMWRHGGYRNDALFTAIHGQEAALDARVTAVATELAARRPQLVERGWIGLADVEWEPVASLPEDVPRTHGHGAFRTSALARVPEPPVARRSPRTSTEALLAWLSSGPDRPWRREPIEIVVTEEYVYTRAPAGVSRIPLASLRTIVRGRGHDRIAIFGKRTRLLLLRRAGCPVVAYLEKRCGSPKPGSSP